ncbi:homoserine dehydrogenase [Lederbergia galactosidilyticus]|uniref:homoserine dehydrogenase n=1 Tax=Lederbergia galactosidilytica TaxID=217031 RepID=UPI001AE66665|nr:homoserine dehydrogenase [Lederbergia galactosidilytica]MBP1913301.1 homoserine dehydrogenase [Lederbergia galactosidilytica]
MPIIKAALLGLGTVGAGVYEVIRNQQEKLKELVGAKVQVVAVLIQDTDKEREVEKDVLVTNNIQEILAIPDLDVIFESIVGAEPTNRYLDEAIEYGCHIITANKEMFAKHGEALLEKALENDVQIGFEATVAAGVPVIRTIQQQLQLNKIGRVQALLNGTSNFILTEMRKKQLPFAKVLKTAQSLGFAEADPTNDVEGIDAFYKIMILSQLIYGEQPEWNTVELKGIASVPEDKIYHSDGRYKHIAELEKVGDRIQATVRPIIVDEQHPLYSVEGVDNAVVLETSLAGAIMIQGPGAGSKPTASAMLEDFIHIFQDSKAAVLS